MQLKDNLTIKPKKKNKRTPFILKQITEYLNTYIIKKEGRQEGRKEGLCYAYLLFRDAYRLYTCYDTFFSIFNTCK